MAKEKSMAKRKRKTATEIIEPLGGLSMTSDKLVEVSGVCLDVWDGSDSTFLPMLKKDMSASDRKKAVRGITKQACLLADKLYAVMGETLYEIRENSYWKNWTYESVDGSAGVKIKFKSFEEYLEKECEVKRRTAYYYIKVYEKLIVELGIPPHILRTVEWSKAKELVPYMDKDNWKDLIKIAKDKTVRGLRTYLADLEGGGALKSKAIHTDLIKRLNFNLSEEQHENILLAFKIAAKTAESSSQGNLLDLICTSYIAESPDDLDGTDGLLVQLDQLVRSVERNFGVKLELVEGGSSKPELIGAGVGEGGIEEFLDEEEV